MFSMATKKTPPAAKATNPRAKGLKPVVVRLDQALIASLKAEALRRANERGSLQPDASEIVREALSGWFKRR